MADVAQQQIDAFLQKYANMGANNRIMRRIDIERMQQAANQGFPKNMYHKSLAPRLVLNEEQEAALREYGYGENYQKQDFPRFIFRRNFDQKFEKEDFIEKRLVKDQAQLDGAHKERIVETRSAWVEEAGALEEMAPIPDQTIEPANLRAARLEGQLEALKSEKRGK